MAVGLRARLTRLNGRSAPANGHDGASALCPACSSESANGAYFCMHCGWQLRGVTVGQRLARLRWEYRDVVVPLGFVHRGRAETQRQVDAAVLAALGAYGGEGWQSDGPTDFETLEAFERIATKQRFVWYRWRDELTCESVTLRLKRLVG